MPRDYHLLPHKRVLLRDVLNPDVPPPAWRLTDRHFVPTAQALLAICGFLVVSRGDSRALNAPLGMVAVVAVLALLAVVLSFKRGDTGRANSSLQLLLAGGATGVLALSAAYAISFYLRIPADLVSFSESQFVGDLMRLRAGELLYTPPADNNSYPYMPGTQMLTYGLASLAGYTDSIVAWRFVQYAYVVAAALVGAAAVMELCRRLGAKAASGWFVLSFAVLLLVTGDPRFNLYTHSLHNDGLSLLVSLAAFLAVARHLREPGMVTSILLVLLPPVGLLVKQNGLVWLGLIALCTWVARPETWRQVFVRAGASAFLCAVVVFVGYRTWGGPDFLWWVFGALGGKDVEVFRSAFNLLNAGIYASFLMGAAVVLRVSRADRQLWALFFTSGLLFGVNAYTSGIGFQANHLGPGVMLATVWGLASGAWLWHRSVAARDIVSGWIVVSACLLVPAGLGLVRYPRNQVPEDISRYVTAIESEFAGVPTSKVLLDDGNWVYLRDGIVMRDRGASVSVHLGVNQKEPGLVHLVRTAERIRAREYQRILVRNFDAGRSLYGFEVPDAPIVLALREHYEVVRRIPSVNAPEWWPKLLLGEIAVLEPKADP